MTVAELIARLEVLNMPDALVEMEINITTDYGNGDTCAAVEEVRQDEMAEWRDTDVPHVILWAHLSI